MKALIVQGGWEGHYPRETADAIKVMMEKLGFDVEISNTLDVFLDKNLLEKTDVLIPVWTGGSITQLM